MFFRLLLTSNKNIIYLKINLVRHYAILVILGESPNKFQQFFALFFICCLPARLQLHRYWMILA